MELTKNIFFNTDKLTSNTKVTIEEDHTLYAIWQRVFTAYFTKYNSFSGK